VLFLEFSMVVVNIRKHGKFSKEDMATKCA
jgi:hypothetical protein